MNTGYLADSSVEGKEQATGGLHSHPLPCFTPPE